MEYKLDKKYILKEYIYIGIFSLFIFFGIFYLLIVVGVKSSEASILKCTMFSLGLSIFIFFTMHSNSNTMQNIKIKISKNGIQLIKKKQERLIPIEDIKKIVLVCLKHNTKFIIINLANNYSIKLRGYSEINQLSKELLNLTSLTIVEEGLTKIVKYNFINS